MSQDNYHIDKESLASISWIFFWWTYWLYKKNIEDRNIRLNHFGLNEES